MAATGVLIARADQERLDRSERRLRDGSPLLTTAALRARCPWAHIMAGPSHPAVKHGHSHRPQAISSGAAQLATHGGPFDGDASFLHALRASEHAVQSVHSVLPVVVLLLLRVPFVCLQRLSVRVCMRVRVHVHVRVRVRVRVLRRTMATSVRGPRHGTGRPSTTPSKGRGFRLASWSPTVKASAASSNKGCTSTTALSTRPPSMLARARGSRGSSKAAEAQANTRHAQTRGWLLPTAQLKPPTHGHRRAPRTHTQPHAAP